MELISQIHLHMNKKIYADHNRRFHSKITDVE